MSRAWTATRRRVGSGAGSQVGGDDAAALVKLGKRFAQFRSEHPRRTRIPDELREAVLAVSPEVAPASLYQACGISYGQVMAWKAAKAQEPESPDLRVFSVVDEESVQRPAPALSAAAPALELRLGPFSVSVRLAGPATAVRG